MITNTDQTYTYHFDPIGSTVAMTDMNENIVNSYAYTPFGVLTESETIPQPFKYVGQYGVMHEPNGLYYMRARYYDPELGRFISEDPIGFEGGDVNLMRYVGNQPIDYIDPEGLARYKIPGWADDQMYDYKQCKKKYKNTCRELFEECRKKSCNNENNSCSESDDKPWGACADCYIGYVGCHGVAAMANGLCEVFENPMFQFPVPNGYPRW